MKKSLKVLVFLGIFFFALNINVLAGPRSGYQDPICEYQSTLGPKIESYSKSWNTKEKLMQIYKELMKNYISSEISKLKYIYIYPDIEEGVSGYYDPDIILKNDGSYAMGDNSYIVILGCDDSCSLSTISKTLTHEYGHHFTTYHIVTSEGKYGKGWITTRYASIRGLNNITEVKNYNSISGNSMWDIAEIAAWDYVELFGNPDSKISIDYKDVQERADFGYSKTIALSSNSMPQENLDLPLATSNKKVYEYFMSLAGGNSNKPSDNYTSSLSINKKFLVQNKYNLYRISWDSMQGDNYEYTIIMHPQKDSSNIIPIKTTKTGEENVAYIGSYAGNKSTICETYQGIYKVRIFIKDSKGFVYEGKSININFDENLAPISNYSSIFSDLLKTHWAYNYIITLSKKGIITGYTDGTFKPEGTVTKKEFLALLMRISKLDLTPYQTNSDDWFTKEGYLAAAKAYAIITTNDYGNNYQNLKLNNKITREEMSFMIARVLIANKYTVSVTDSIKFKDSVKKQYKTEIKLVTKYGILSGYPDGTFKGSNNASRSEAAKMIYKTYKLLD